MPRLSGTERICANDLELDSGTVLDFWRWAFSDLRMNDIRGVFAEWLVARLLGIDPPVRDSWADWDLETSEGVRIEVKSSAYVQAWPQERPSVISFAGLAGQRLIPGTATYAGNKECKADLYVFCVQIEQDRARWDALDLDQWRFYVLPRAEVARKECRSLSLSSLKTCCQEMTAAQFAACVPDLIIEVTASPQGGVPEGQT